MIAGLGRYFMVDSDSGNPMLPCSRYENVVQYGLGTFVVIGVPILHRGNPFEAIH